MFFTQDQKPGEVLAVDWTVMDSLGKMIEGKELAHKRVPRGLAGVAERISEDPLTARSGPSDFCKSPMASISASRALARAVAMSCSWPDVRSEIADKDNSPTAMIVSRIISESVMTRAKPLLGSCGMSVAG